MDVPRRYTVGLVRTDDYQRICSAQSWDLYRRISQPSTGTVIFAPPVIVRLLVQHGLESYLSTVLIQSVNLRR
jgi:hypothetical protein